MSFQIKSIHLIILGAICCGLLVISLRQCYAQKEIPLNVVMEEEAAMAKAEPVIAEEVAEVLEPVIDDSLEKETEKINLTGDLVRQAWEASSRNDLETIKKIADQCVLLYEKKAILLNEQLAAFPPRGEDEKYQPLNNLGTCLFVKAEALMNNGMTGEAIALFEHIISNYKWSQSWDPSRGGYWSVAEKSQASIDILTGKAQEEIDKTVMRVKRTIPTLHSVGLEKIVDYAKYGEFMDVGKAEYKYLIKDVEGLKAAIGEGIYPNTTAAYNNPRYKIVKEEGRLEGSHWDFINTYDLEAAYFKWATARDDMGIKLFFLGIIFEKSQMYYEAIRAYHSLIVHYPKTVGWTYWQTPWYSGQAAVAKIKHIIRTHPELNLMIKWMNVKVENGYDNEVGNDVIIPYPGKIMQIGLVDKVKEKWPFAETENLGKAVRRVGEGKVQLVQYENDHWQMMVDGKPLIIRGITYAPTKIGQTPDKGTLKNWMEEDSNKNGLIDGPYEAWVDANGNNLRDADEPVVGDFQLMKDMGVNAIRMYHQPERPPNKELLRKMHKEYGFYVIMGNFLGKYAIGSGASWSEGTDYENLDHRENMLNSVKQLVRDFKDEPYILLWLLGNENNYGVASNADKKPETYYRFVNEVAAWIKSVDGNHPVAVNNGDTLFLDIFARHSSNVDIFAANVYRGDYGFGSFWEQVKDATGKPAFIAEYGCPAYAPHLTKEEAEEAQAQYHQGNWMDIEENIAGKKQGIGNAIGGVAFEWLDEWWKNYEPFLHDRKSDVAGPFPGGYYFEEWFGLVGQGKGQQSPFLRQPRKSYYQYKELWNN